MEIRHMAEAEKRQRGGCRFYKFFLLTGTVIQKYSSVGH
jgi:hypothetical protein